MLDTHKIVFVVTFTPSFEGASVGGFDWFAAEWDARASLISHLSSDQGEPWTHDYTIRSIPVPRDLDNEGVTSYLEENPEWREVALPAEWEAIRVTGGAIDLTKED
jgi:hypothetical protein